MIKYLVLFLILTLIVCVYYLSNSYFIESFSDIHLYNNKNPQKRYIFWTGGFDSTYLVLEALFRDGDIVIPIYLNGIIDNNPDAQTRRHNQTQELKAIKNITQTIYSNSPENASRLKPLILVNKTDLSPDVKQSMDILYRKKMVRRPICQYASLAQTTLDLNQPIELAVEYEPHSSMMYKAIYRYVDGFGFKRKVSEKFIKKYPELNIYRHFRFSTLHLSKQKMLQNSKIYGFSQYLHKTWSCWYPRNGNPCGKCIMCLERII